MDRNIRSPWPRRDRGPLDGTFIFRVCFTSETAFNPACFDDRSTRFVFWVKDPESRCYTVMLILRQGFNRHPSEIQACIANDARQNGRNGYFCFLEPNDTTVLGLTGLSIRDTAFRYMAFLYHFMRKSPLNANKGIRSGNGVHALDLPIQNYVIHDFFIAATSSMTAVFPPQWFQNILFLEHQFEVNTSLVSHERDFSQRFFDHGRVVPFPDVVIPQPPPVPQAVVVPPVVQNIIGRIPVYEPHVRALDIPRNVPENEKAPANCRYNVNVEYADHSPGGQVHQFGLYKDHGNFPMELCEELGVLMVAEVQDERKYIQHLMITSRPVASEVILKKIEEHFEKEGVQCLFVQQDPLLPEIDARVYSFDRNNWYLNGMVRRFLRTYYLTNNSQRSRLWLRDTTIMDAEDQKLYLTMNRVLCTTFLEDWHIKVASNLRELMPDIRQLFDDIKCIKKEYEALQTELGEEHEKALEKQRTKTMKKLKRAMDDLDNVKKELLKNIPAHKKR